MALDPEGNGGWPRVLLGVSGCIAAYKACEVLRGLQKAGCDVRVVMTADAERFVGPTTFSALSGHEVADDLYSFGESAIPHIDLSEWADLFLVCPCTANVLAKAGAGIADDCLTSTLLAATSPVLLAPAMNVHMWENPATQANVATLEDRGMSVVSPVSGRLACGDVGEGKLPDVEDIVSAALAALRDVPADLPLAGRTLVVTAGPTHEAIDAVRYIANASSGKMGYALARAARRMGAHVVLVSGPVSLPSPAGVDVVRVTSAEEMRIAALGAFEGADALICAAAVADYAPARPAADHKLKKSTERLTSVELVETRDILAEASRDKGDRVVVGFAAETSDVIGHASEKLASKGCDLVVANDVSRADSTFGSDTDRVALVDASGVEELPTLPKDRVADAVVSRVAALLGRA